MDRAPTVNDFLDLIRPALSDTVEQLRREIQTIENGMISQGQTGAGIRSILDAGRNLLKQGIEHTLETLRHVEGTGRIERSQLRQVTYQELGNFSLAVKSVMKPDRLKSLAQNSAGVAKIVGEAMAAVDSELNRLVRLYETGLLNLPARAGSAEFNSGAFNTATFNDPGIDAARIAAERQKLQVAAISAASPPTGGIVTPDSLPPKPDAKTSTGLIVLQNQAAIALSAAAFMLLVDDRLTSLREKNPNSEESKKERDQEIAEYENLKTCINEVLNTATQFVRREIEEEKVVEPTISFSNAISNWWTKRHVEICERAFDMGIFSLGLTICSLTGADSSLSVAVAGAIAGGKNVVEAIKALYGASKAPG